MDFQLLDRFLAFESIFHTVLAFYSIFGYWVDFLVEIWLLGGFLAFESIFGRVFSFYSIFGFGWIFCFWVDF